MRKEISKFIADCQAVIDERLGKAVEILKAEEYEHDIRVVRHVNKGTAPSVSKDAPINDYTGEPDDCPFTVPVCRVSEPEKQDDKPVIERFVYCFIEKATGAVHHSAWGNFTRDKKIKRSFKKQSTVCHVTDENAASLMGITGPLHA